jgi:hypothetical protein
LTHTTPRFLDLEQEYEDGYTIVEKHPSIHVEVADAILVDLPSHEEVLLYLTDTDGDPFTVRLKNVIYVPGLTQRLLSVSQFAQTDNTSEIAKHIIDLTITDHLVIFPFFSATRIAFNNITVQKKTVTRFSSKIGTFRLDPLETRHGQFCHRHSNTIPFA